MTRAFHPWALFLAAGLLAGCHAVDARIRERPAAFAALEPARQREVRAGIARPGDTADQVYLALGRPARVQDYAADPTEAPRAAGPVTIWYYFTLASGNPRFDPAPGTEGVPAIDPTPDSAMAYRQTAVLVVLQRGVATKVRYFR